MLAEVPDFVSSLRKQMTSDADPKLAIEKGVFRWNATEPTPESTKDDHPFQLGEINIEFPQGKLTVISGPVGSGKVSGSC